MTQREQVNTSAKQAIARAALEWLGPEPGITLLVDAGTTTGAFARLLPTESNLTIITNSVLTAASLAAAGQTRVQLCLVSILRAGSGILDGFLSVVPGARVGHIGLYRDPETLQAVEYYFKMPLDMGGRDVIAVDPMLAPGDNVVMEIELITGIAIEAGLRCP